MTEKELKEKFAEFLSLREQYKKLTKADASETISGQKRLNPTTGGPQYKRLYPKRYYRSMMDMLRQQKQGGIRKAKIDEGLSVMDKIKARKERREPTPIPADVSKPIKENRVDYSPPAKVSGPNVLNAYKSESRQESTAWTGGMMRVRDAINILKNGMSKAKVDQQYKPEERQKVRQVRLGQPQMAIPQPNPKDPVLSGYDKKGPIRKR